MTNHTYTAVVVKEEERKGRKSINLTIVSTNNHHAGFGPWTANIFISMVGLPEAAWSNDDKDKKEEDDKSYLHSSSCYIQQQNHNSKQSTISDFMA